MSDQRMISYDYDRLNRSADGISAVHQQGTGHVRKFQAQASAYGEWWNPDNDGNDLIGTTFGAVNTPVFQKAISNTQKNLDALYTYAIGQREMTGNSQMAEASTIESIGLAGKGGNGNGH